MPDFLLGRDAKAYFSTTLLTGANTAAVLAASTLASNIKDLSLELDSEYVDTTTRAEAAQGFKSEIAVLKNGRITFEARWKPGDAFFDALIDVWTGATSSVAFAAFDQLKATSGAQGLVANFSVGISKTENLADIQRMNVTLTIASWPEWYVV